MSDFILMFTTLPEFHAWPKSQFRNRSVFHLCPSVAKISRRWNPRAPKTIRLTPSQRQAVAARGNVLVMAGAGTGKTHTLVERCLDCLCRERASLDEILVVTFTEAAAAEMHQRLRTALEEKSRLANLRT